MRETKTTGETTQELQGQQKRGERCLPEQGWAVGGENHICAFTACPLSRAACKLCLRQSLFLTGGTGLAVISCPSGHSCIKDLPFLVHLPLKPRSCQQTRQQGAQGDARGLASSSPALKVTVKLKWETGQRRAHMCACVRACMCVSVCVFACVCYENHGLVARKEDNLPASKKGTEVKRCPHAAFGGICHVRAVC